MLKKEINNIELSVENPYEIQLVSIPAGIYRLRIIHQSRAVFDRPRSLFFTFDIPGLTPQEIRDLLGLKDISAQNGVFAYTGGGEEKAGFYLQEVELNVTQELSLLILGIKTFLQHIDISIDILQLSLLSSFNNDYVEVLSNDKSDGIETKDDTDHDNDHTYIDFSEINSISFASFSLTRQIPKKLYLKNIKKGNYSFEVEHQSEELFNNYKNLFFTFEIPGVESLEQTKDLLGLKSISPVNGVFSYLGHGVKKADRSKAIKNITIKENLDKLVITVNTFLESDIKIDELYVKKYKSDIDLQAEEVTGELTRSIKELRLKEGASQELYLKKGNSHFLYEINQENSINFLDLEVQTEIITNNKNIDYRLLILIDCFDKDGNKVDKIPGLGISAAFQKPFKYFSLDPIEVDGNLHKRRIKLELPILNSKYKVYIAAVGISEEDTLRVSVKKEDNTEKNDTEYNNEETKVLGPIERNISAGKSINELNVACILDEFTTECLRHEINLIPLGKETWIEEISTSIDFLLVESCWRGNNGEWGTLTKGSGGAGKLSGLLRYCQDNHIPTVFWNKEDPPHYEKFAPIAKFFDLVITTDVNMISKYKKDFNIEAHALSFAAQPKIHFPNTSIKRQNKAVFAGSYYGDKPKRCLDFNHLMAQVKQAGINFDIYDRNFNRDIEKFNFPKEYEKNILGTLSPDQMYKAHQGYKYQINMNTVQDSMTMFARRVYESLASGTPVISNDSVGVRNLFGDLVLFSNQNDHLALRLKELEDTPSKYDELAKEGVRRVMRNHTYSHRIKEICELLGIKVFIEQPKLVMAFTVDNESEIEKVKSLFLNQTAKNKHLFIEMTNFADAYKYLCESTSEISYSMAFAKDLYQNLHDYYGSDIVLNASLGKEMNKEALEDYYYWKEKK